MIEMIFNNRLVPAGHDSSEVDESKKSAGFQQQALQEVFGAYLFF